MELLPGLSQSQSLDTRNLRALARGDGDYRVQEIEKVRRQDQSRSRLDDEQARRDQQLEADLQNSESRVLQAQSAAAGNGNDPLPRGALVDLSA